MKAQGLTIAAVVATVVVGGGVYAVKRAPSSAASISVAASQVPSFLDDRRMPTVPARASAEADSPAKAAADTAKRIAEADASRRANDELKRLADAERRATDEKKRLADAETARAAQEQKRIAEADAERRATEEKKRLADAETAKRTASVTTSSATTTAALGRSDTAITTPPLPTPEPTAPIVVASAQVPTLPTPRAAATPEQTCAAAQLTADGLASGQSRISLSSPCRKTQSVKLTYGPIELDQTIGADGKLAVVLDMLFDAQQPVVAVFADGSKQSVTPVGLDLDKVTKVAIVWQGPADLEMHAFEYAAFENEPGHVWSGAAQTGDEAKKRTAADGRGHGFLSTLGAPGSKGGRVQVYTFVHSAGGEPGVVAMRLDYASRGAVPKGDACGSGHLSSVNFDVIVRERGGVERVESNVIPAANCGEALARTVRLMAGAVPDIRVRN